MSSLMFYSKPIALDKNLHKNLKLKRQDSYVFAQDANSIPVAGFEFFEASRSFPIFFARNKNGDYLPIAILSLRQTGHDLGPTWKDAYVPAYVRRYPFVLSSDGMVLFDESAPHMQENEGEALFDDAGEPTTFTRDIVKFLETVDQGYRLTEAFSKALAEKAILEPFKGQIKYGQSTINLGDLYSINEKKLHEVLSEKEVAEWFNKGWLAWSHAHLHSLGSVHEIIKRARDANSAKDSNAETPVAQEGLQSENYSA